MQEKVMKHSVTLDNLKGEEIAGVYIHNIWFK